MAKGGGKIDILFLVDRLEALLGKGSRVPFSSKIIVDEEPLLNVIDQMRVSIPDEIKQAKRIDQERQREVDHGREEAAQIIAEAREEATRLLDEHEIRHAAEVQAQRILSRAGEQAGEISSGAADYAGQVLTQLAQHLSKVEGVVHNGLRALDSDQFRRSPSLPASDPEPTDLDEEDSPDS